MNMRFLLPLLIALLVFSVGCRKTAVTPSGGPAAEIQAIFTVQDMREAILKGCADKNWRAVEIDAQTIEATMDVRGKRSVVVSIPYTATSYTINYKSSVKMKYKAKSDGGAAVHGAYNRWVKSLDQSIQAQIGQKKK